MHIDPLVIPIATQIMGESLPISSSGHMMLVTAVLERFGFASIIAMPDFLDHFLHSPTLIVIALYFYQAWWAPMRMLLNVFCAWFKVGCSYDALRDSHKQTLWMFLYIAGLVIVADSVTACCYAVVHVMLKNNTFLNSLPALLFGFVVTGLVLLSSRNQQRPAIQINFSIAFILGLVQGLALFPGVSRFACTVVAAQWLGVSPRRALQFSFLMFFPLIAAAFFLNGLPMVLTNQTSRIFLSPAWLMIYGFATIVAYRLFVGACRMFERNQLWWSGLYMILPASVVVLLMM